MPDSVRHGPPATLRPDHLRSEHPCSEHLGSDHLWSDRPIRPHHPLRAACALLRRRAVPAALVAAAVAAAVAVACLVEGVGRPPERGSGGLLWSLLAGTVLLSAGLAAGAAAAARGGATPPRPATEPQAVVVVARRIQALAQRQLDCLGELTDDLSDDLSDDRAEAPRRRPPATTSTRPEEDRPETSAARPDEALRQGLLTGLSLIDHHAVRIRRQAENLALLAGAAPRRTCSRPTRVAEVLRRCAAQSGHAGRITLAPPVDATLRGEAVSAVTHLVAELLQNAAEFSAPTTRVLLRARPVPAAGLAVEIDDRGRGMTQAERSRLNALLAGEGDGAVAELLREGHVGLVVVAKLAHRHGVVVQLQTNVYGGVQAVALLPHQLLTGEPPHACARAGETRAARPRRGWRRQPSPPPRPTAPCAPVAPSPGRAAAWDRAEEQPCR